MKKIFVSIFFVLFFLTACSQTSNKSPSQAPSDAQAELPITVTTSPRPTQTEVPPTDTPIPTETAIPTETQVPTYTNTPTPTNTPTVTPTFSPDTLSFAPGDPLKIGYLFMVANPLGIDSLRGVEIAIADFNGEIFGHRIELTGFDSECNVLAAQRGAQILIQDDSVVGILGTTCSAGALRAAPIVTDGNSVMISPSNSSPELTAPDSRTAGYFRTGPNDLYQVKAAAQFAYDELGARRLATVYVASDKFQKLQSETLCEVFTELGGECVLETTRETGNTYMVPAINTLIEAAPDVIYFMSWDFAASAAFLSEAKAAPELENVALFVWEGLMNPDFLQQAGDNALGVYVTKTSYEIDQDTESYQVFLDTYRRNYGEEPISVYHPYAYDAATLLLKAIAKVAVQEDDGSLMVDPLAVRDSLYSLNEFTGLSGLISCSPLGDCARNTEGQVYVFTSGDPSTFNPGPADSLSSNPSQVWP
jgi:branched-chain amino acid transport system substrate-binding protein